MQRIINKPDMVVELKGFLKAHGDIFVSGEHERVVKYREAPIAGKVGVVTGGGSGHKPAFIGYVGRNMVDAVAVGEVFASPTAVAFLEAMKAADSGKGMACLYGNYAGDNMNVKMAIRMAQKAGTTVKTVVANDDVASAPIFYNRVAELLEEKNISIYRPYVGNLFTSLEMMGITLTLMKLDSKLKELIDMEIETMGIKQFGRK